jgi:hypothetical protein
MRPVPVLAVLGALALPGLTVGDAHASSIVYAKGDNVWLTTPDGARQVQVTHDGGYAGPSQADDGTIVALKKDNRFYRLDRRGTPQGPPVPTWLNGSVPGFAGPLAPKVSPDGTKIAYAWSATTSSYDYQCGCPTATTDFATAYTYSDRYTDPNALGKFRSWSWPSWIDSSHTAVFNPGAGSISPNTPDVAFHELGHANPSSEDDLAHLYKLFSDPDAPTLRFGEMTRAGDKLAIAEDVPAIKLRLYATPGRPSPGGANYDVAYRCQLENPPGGRFSSLSWSPDGSSLAYEAGADIYVVHVGDISQGCGQLGAAQKIVSAGTSPSWGPADVPTTVPAPPSTTTGGDATGPRVTASLVGGQKLRRALARGLRVRVASSEAGSVKLTAAVLGRKTVVASGRAKVVGGASCVVTLRFTRNARRTLRATRKVRLAIATTARDAAGNTSGAHLRATIGR